MAKTLTKIGNSYGIIIPKSLLGALGAAPDSQYVLAIEDGQTLRVRFLTRREQEILRITREFTTRYDDALRQLAD